MNETLRIIFASPTTAIACALFVLALATGLLIACHGIAAIIEAIGAVFATEPADTYEPGDYDPAEWDDVRSSYKTRELAK